MEVSRCETRCLFFFFGIVLVCAAEHFFSTLQQIELLRLCKIMI